MRRPTMRQLAAGDEDLLRSTRLRALADAPAAFGTLLSEAEARGDEFWIAQVAGRLGESRCATWVAVDDATGEGVGMLAGVVQQDAVEVIQVWIDPRWRGSGLVEEAFAALFAWAPRERIDIAVASSNARARRVYERIGFVLVGERPGVRDAELELSMPCPSPLA